MDQRNHQFDGSGKRIRLGRILDPRDRRGAVVAFDHGFHVGVIPGVEQPCQMLETLAEAGADAFLVSPGVARHCASVFVGRGAPGMIVRVDWSNRWRGQDALGFAEGRTRMVASAEDAVSLGADAVLAYMFIGYEDARAEVEQVQAAAELIHACDALGIGCIIEPMPRGRQVDDNSLRPDHIALGARIACELGADVLKTDYSGSAETFRQVVRAAFRPILIAGGAKTPSLRELLEMVRGALDAGASGMFIGRNVFQTPDPGRTMTVLRRVIHEDLDLDTALAAMAG